MKVHGSNYEKVKNDDLAFIAGCKIAEINTDSYKQAIRRVPSELAIGFMPFDTNDGLAKVDWKQHYAFVMGLFHNSPIFESRDNGDLRSAFIGEKQREMKYTLKIFKKPYYKLLD